MSILTQHLHCYMLTSTGSLNLSTDVGCDHLTRTLFDKMRQFFLVEASPATESPTFMFHVPGMKKPLRPHQAYIIYWQFLQDSSKIRGGFICDEMGLGKTVMMIGYIVVNRLRNIAHYQYREWLSGKACAGKIHHKLDAVVDVDNKASMLTCPNKTTFGVCCPCPPKGPTRNIPPSFGPTLVIVPKNLIKNFIDQFRRFVGMHEWGVVVDGNTFRPFRLFVQHSDYSKLSMTREDVKLLEPNISEEKAYPQTGQDRLVVLTTQALYSTCVMPMVTFNINGVKYQPVWGRVLRDEFHQNCLKDNPMMNLLSGIKKIQSHFLPAMWFYSGTPLITLPRNMRWYVEQLTKPSWYKDDVLCDCTGEKFDALHKEMAKLCRIPNPEGEAAYRDNIRKAFSTLSMRRTEHSRWINGELLVEMPMVKHRDIECPIPPSYHGDMWELNKTLSDNAHRALEAAKRTWAKLPALEKAKSTEPDAISITAITHASNKVSICATFPALASIRKNYWEAEEEEETYLQLTGKEIVDNQWHTFGWEGSPYYEHLDRIFASSGKLEVLDRILRKVLGRTTDPYSHKPMSEKIVIMSRHPLVVMLVGKASRPLSPLRTAPCHNTRCSSANLAGMSQWVQANHNSNAQVVHGWDTGAQRDRALNAWQDSPTQDSNPDNPQYIVPMPEGTARSRVLVASVGKCGTGLNLIQSFRLILIEPTYQRGMENQVFACIRRINQPMHCVYYYWLYSDPNVIKVDKLVMMRQNRSSMFTMAAFAPGPPPTGVLPANPPPTSVLPPDPYSGAPTA